jgi:D-alanyl-D-alanine carboxypeptidase
LIERGVFHWNDTLFETLPINIVESIHPGHRNTTLDMLTLHVSGIADLEAPLPPPLLNTSILPEEGRRIWTTHVLSKPPITTPGTNFTYSNTGFVILGHILESRLHTTWEALITAELFGKVGMKDCGFGTPPESTNSSIENPWPHLPSESGPLPVNPKSPYSDNIKAMGPAGTVHCSLKSWSKFIQLHLDGHAGHSTPVLKQSSFVTLHTPGSSLSAYTRGAWDALSNVQQPWAKGLVLTHAGSNTLNFAVAWLDLDANQAYLAVTNVGGQGAGNGTNQAVVEMISRNVLEYMR